MYTIFFIDRTVEGLEGYATKEKGKLSKKQILNLAEYIEKLGYDLIVFEGRKFGGDLIYATPSESDLNNLLRG